VAEQNLRQSADLAGPGIMLLSAAVFAYFGFGTTWLHNSVSNGQFLIYVALLDYTLKATAIGFGVAAVITMVMNKTLGNMMYATLGLLSALMFLIIVIMDWLDPANTTGMSFLLLIFAGWNGYGSWMSLQELRGAKAPVSAA
jgi:hypothetical protein